MAGHRLTNNITTRPGDAYHELYDTTPNSYIKHAPLVALLYPAIGVLHKIPHLHKSLLPTGRNDIDLLKKAVGV